MSEDVPSGWGWPGASRKSHFFVKGRALCMKWLFFGPLDPDLRKSSDDCAACRRAFEKRATGGEVSKTVLAPASEEKPK